MAQETFKKVIELIGESQSYFKTLPSYYARWAAMRKLLLQFLAVADPSSVDGTPRKQVLSLGAGFDTLFFQLKDEGRAPHLFVELDFMEVTTRKAGIIASHGELVSKLGPELEIHKGKGEILSEQYKLLAADLRDLNGLDAVFERAGLDPSLPTIIIAECVLIYLDPEVSRAVVKWAAEKLSTAAFVIYEQIHPEDAFGQQMIRNLESRGCGLLGLEDTPTLESKVKRFTDLGWQRADALNMDVIYNQHLEPVDRRRIERLEIFDEFEEWHIMQEHYCVAFGINDPTCMLEDISFSLPKQASLQHPQYFSPASQLSGIYGSLPDDYPEVLAVNGEAKWLACKIAADAGDKVAGIMHYVGQFCQPTGDALTG